jgi:hypothetical protein
MRTKVLGSLLALAVVSLSFPAFGQATAPRAPRTRATLPKQQTPFTAELKVTSVRTLTNGATITRESTEVRAVDSQGRMMTSITRLNPSGDEQTSVNVSDPIERTHISWDSVRKQATMIQMPAPGAARTSCPAIAPAAPATNPPPASLKTTTSEDLGVETIDGVEAHGRRTTTTTPAGAVGNNEPLVRTVEVWLANAIAPINLVVREISDDPESGRTTRELTSLTLSEPPLSTFQPPEGYEIVTREPQTGCPAAQKASAPAQ